MTRDAPLSLEQRIARIEAIVTRLESDRLELEEALSLFEEAIVHVRDAERVLRQTEVRIDRLIAEADGSVTMEPVRDPES